MIKVGEEWVERVYGLVAEGSRDEALQAFKDEFPFLRPVEHEKRLAAVIARGRSKELAE
jgi:hypothetical protein